MDDRSKIVATKAGLLFNCIAIVVYFSTFIKEQRFIAGTGLLSRFSFCSTLC